jgi:hypothetical protein
MRNFSKHLFLLITGSWLTIISAQPFAQGCSDAGFCTIPIRPAAADKNSFRSELSYLRGEEDTHLWAVSLSYSRQVSKQWQWDHKLVATHVNGGYGTVSNLSDIYSTDRYSIKTGKGKQMHILGGVKIPFNQSNLKIRNISLPMVYQTSLGTYDLILGTAFTTGKLDMNLAVQLPVIQSNRNSFFKDLAPILGEFPSTNLFRRKADVLWRVGLPIKSKSGKWRFDPNLLAIYHLGEDSYENRMGDRQNIPGSAGLTLNGNLQATHQLNAHRYLQFSIASPFIVRNNRPDGLTRSLVISVSYGFGW